MWKLPELLPIRQRSVSGQIVEDMDNSKNEGFTVLNKAEVSCRVRYLGNIMEWKSGEKTEIPEALCKVMETVCRDYDYLIQ